MGKQGEDVVPKFDETTEFVEQQAPTTPSFDETTPFQETVPLKKKEQTVASSPSTSELAGSTSELAGSTSVSPQRTDIPTLTQSDIDAIDFQSIADQPQDRPSIPQVKTFQDVKTSARKSHKIEILKREYEEISTKY